MRGIRGAVSRNRKRRIACAGVTPSWCSSSDRRRVDRVVLRPPGWDDHAGIVTAAALLIVQLVPVPGLSLAVYALVIAWSLAVYFLGSRITARARGSAATGQATSWVKNLLKRD